MGVEGAAPAAPLAEKAAKWAAAVAKDLKAHAGKGLVLVGDGQPAYVHALGHAINAKLNNHGENGTVTFIEPIEVDPVDHLASLTELVNDIEAGKVETLVILGGNPVYTAPVDLGAKPDPPRRRTQFRTNFARSLSKVPLTIRLGLHDDETSDGCTWHIPEAHFLETWGDTRAFDGTAAIVQPMIKPLYNGKTAHETHRRDDGPVRPPAAHGRPRVLASHQARRGLRAVLAAGAAHRDHRRDGGQAEDRHGQGRRRLRRPSRPPPRGSTRSCSGPTRRSGTDGIRNNGWLQELPKPITKLVWDNAAIVGFGTAEKLGLKKDQIVELTYQGRMIKAPVFIVPGQAEGTVVLHFGYGRWRAGVIAMDHGFNAYELRTAAAPWGGSGLEDRRDQRGPTRSSPRRWSGTSRGATTSASPR